MGLRLPSLQAALAYLTIIFATLFLYVIGVITYRLVFSPLARFPGPRLAAATRLYETYFQMVKGGTFTWHIESLHEIYGPIVRITPWELHIKDPNFYDTLYAGPGKHRNKDPWFSYISYPKSIFSTQAHETHRPRRRVLGQFFKKAAASDIQPIIQASIASLCKHLSEANATKKPMELHAAFYSFTSDVISEYALGHKYGLRYLERPELSDEWKLRLTSMFGFCRHIRHLPILPFFARLAPRMVGTVVPPYRYVYEMEEDIKGRVKALLDDHTIDSKIDPEKTALPSKTQKAVYPSILADPSVPSSEKELSRLQDDAIFLMMAATDAPAQVLAITLFHILNNPAVYARLKEELFSALDNAREVPTFEQLENIPYLNAVVREGLRLSSVVTTRLPRSAPDEVLQFQEWQIPPGGG
ncbi:hypothetical protein N7470_007639 [Penicillium chermesinum]|nr:hypothetical protein N7470_007639 [Penicillium chermesinum]